MGFYFGLASWRGIDAKTRQDYEETLKRLGRNLSAALQQNTEMREAFSALLANGFIAFVNNEEVSAERWISQIGADPKNCKVIMRLYANNLGIIEMSTIDACISNVIFLMNGISGKNSNKRMLPPLTPEQRAKKAELLARIGSDGEKFILESETKRLMECGRYVTNVYPYYAASESDSYGYDIKSLDDNGAEIYIEVKTTTARKDDDASHNFFLSMNEFKTYQENKQKYRLYRVYDIYGFPSFDIIDLDKATLISDGYIVKY